jgi:hypothetical protein
LLVALAVDMIGKHPNQHCYSRGSDTPPNDDRNTHLFCSRAGNAMYWEVREVAERACDELNRGVTIPPGGTHICRNFQVKEEAPDRFLIYCEAPAEFFKGSAVDIHGETNAS